MCGDWDINHGDDNDQDSECSSLESLFHGQAYTKGLNHENLSSVILASSWVFPKHGGDLQMDRGGFRRLTEDKAEHIIEYKNQGAGLPS